MFKGKQLSWNPFRPASLSKRDSKIIKNTYFQEHLPTETSAWFIMKQNKNENVKLSMIWKMLYTAKNMFSIKDFFSKCNQIRSFLRTWSHLLKKFLTENFIFCAVLIIKNILFELFGVK